MSECVGCSLPSMEINRIETSRTHKTQRHSLSDTDQPVQQKCNAGHMCNCKWSSSDIFKSEKEQVKLILTIFYLTQYIQNIISTCIQYKLPTKSFTLFGFCTESFQCVFHASSPFQSGPATFPGLSRHIGLVAVISDSTDLTGQTIRPK